MTSEWRFFVSGARHMRCETAQWQVSRETSPTRCDDWTLNELQQTQICRKLLDIADLLGNEGV